MSARRADGKRADVLAFVAHELRSPLNGIKCWTHVLENLLHDAEPRVKRALAGIMTGVEHQERLIDGLLEATPAMRGNPGLVKHVNSIHPTAEETAMASKDKRKVNPNDEDQRGTRESERPDRGEPDTMEGPGGRDAAQTEPDASIKTTRQGEL